MIISRQKYLEIFNNMTFFILFPGFFFYHSAIGLDLIPAFLGAMLGLILTLFTPLVLASFYYLKGRFLSTYSSIDFLFLFLMLLNISTTLFNAIFSKPYGFSEIIFTQSLSGILGILMCYGLAKTVPFKSKFFLIYICLSLIIMDIIVMYNVGSRGFFYLKVQSENEQFVATYQGFARSMLMVAFFSIILIKNNFYRVMLILITTPALFLNGARTEFIVFVFTLIAFSLRRSQYSLYLGIFVLFCISIILLNTDYLIALLPESRMTAIFDVFTSSSGNSRRKMLDYAYMTVQNNPLFGDYGSYSKLSTGSYAHNIFSAWVNLGILGFLLYISIILISTSYATKVFFSTKYRDNESTMMFVFVVATVVSMVFSKTYGYMMFGFMVGLTSNFVQHIRTNK